MNNINLNQNYIRKLHFRPKNRFFNLFLQCNSAKSLVFLSINIYFDMTFIEGAIADHLPKKLSHYLQ